MTNHSKRYRTAQEKITPDTTYSLTEAVQLLKEQPQAKFNESVELHVHLGIDPKKAEHVVRSSVVLPHGTGQVKKIIAFVTPEQESIAREAGADLIGNAEKINEIKTTGKCDFDVAVATPDVMRLLAPVAKIMGQKGLMPNPKTETVGPNIATLITQLKKGKATFRNDDTGNVHQMIGKVSFEAPQLVENAQAVIDAIKKVKPEDVKGTYLQSVTLTTSMGPAIPVKV